MVRSLASLLLVPATVFTAAAAEPLPFAVTLPPNVKTVKQRGPDFDVYYFNLGDKTYAGAYVGWAPQFDLHQGSGPVRQNLECKNGKVVRREILLVVPEGEGQHSYIHAWTVAGADRAVSESILTSIRIPKKNEGVRASDLKRC